MKHLERFWLLEFWCFCPLGLEIYIYNEIKLHSGTNMKQSRGKGIFSKRGVKEFLRESKFNWSKVSNINNEK